MNLIRSSQPFFPREDIAAITQDITKVLEDGQFRNAKNAATFESMIAKYIGIDDAVAFDSDSSAYETALRYFDIAGGEVVVCTNSFISVPNSVVVAGGKVVFADINADTLSMDPNSLRQNISQRTRGVIVTHIAGFPNPHLKEIMEICREHSLFLIEDATHAIGASLNGKKVGGFGDAAVFAFTPTKVLTTGEGAMLITANAELGEFAKRYRFYGSGVGKTNFVDLGRHMVLPEISAILGIYQLKRLDEFIIRRNEIAAQYDKALQRIGVGKVIKNQPGFLSSYYKYPLILDSTIDKPNFTKRLQDFGIETGNVFYPPCHLQEVYKKRGAFSYGPLSVAETVLSRTITLPMYIGLTDENVEFVTEKMATLYS